MSIKTTIALLLLVGGCVALFLFGPDFAPQIGLAPKPQARTPEATTESLAKLATDRLQSVEIRVPGQPALVLESPAPGKPMELRGNWPIRREEVDRLVRTLRDMRSRFHPIPVTKDTDLKPFGLTEAQKPIEVIVKFTDKDAKEPTTLKLLFGEAPAKAGENPFTRPAYVRLEGKDEILRIGPDVLPVLRHEEDHYRRRQLFPEAVRVRVADNRPRGKFDLEDTPATTLPTFLLDERVKSITITTPKDRVVLTREAGSKLPEPETPADKPDGEATIQPVRLAEIWRITQPIKDRVEPMRLRGILTALPDLWLEKFVDSPQWPDFLYGLGSHPNTVPQIFTLFGSGVPIAWQAAPLGALINLAALPEAVSPIGSITVEFEGAEARTLQVGRVSRTVGNDELRLAKLDKNPLIFELKSERFTDLHLDSARLRSNASSLLGSLRDPSLVRFDNDKVIGIQIASRKGKDEQVIKLNRLNDAWLMESPIVNAADRTEIDGLLGFLQRMEARESSILDSTAMTLPSLAILSGLGSFDLSQYLGLTADQQRKITLRFAPGSGREAVTLIVGKNNNGKRAVRVEGWNRINLIDDVPEPNNPSRLDQPVSRFRKVDWFETARLLRREAASALAGGVLGSSAVFEPSPIRIREVVVERPGAAGQPKESYTLQTDPKSPGKWQITTPFKAETDSSAASQLDGDLRAIQIGKYLYDRTMDSGILTPDMWPAYLGTLGGILSGLDPNSEAFFGFDKPVVTLTLRFSEPKDAGDVVLELGRARNANEHYARLKGSSGVFVVPTSLFSTVDRPAVQFLDRTLIKFGSKPEVQAIRRTMSKQEMEIAQNARALWEMTKPSALKVDQELVDDLARRLSDLRASRIEAVNTKDLAKYGLENPVAVIKLEALDKDKIVEKGFNIGNPVDAAQPDGDRYVQAFGSNTIAVIPGSLAKQLLGEPAKYRDRSFGAGFVNADKIVIERGNRKVTFTREAGKNWKMTEPVAVDAEDEALREVHDLLAKLKVEEFVSDKAADLKPYGLDNPEHWRLYDGSKEVLHLLVGSREKVGPKEKPVDGFRVYAKLADQDAVGLLDMLLTAKLSAEYRKRALWNPLDAGNVNEIAVKGVDDASSFTFTGGKMGWRDAGKPMDRINATEVNALVNALATLRAERFVVDKDAKLADYGLDKPMSITLKTSDGEKRTILLGKMDGKKIYAKIEDPKETAVFLLSEDDSRRLTRDRAEYLDIGLPMKK